MNTHTNSSIINVTPANITSDVELITPGMAEEHLATMRGNRHLNANSVARYADDLRAGAWLLNGAAIIFDAGGHLIDGQHRLHAVIASGVAMRSLVVRGVAPLRVGGETLHPQGTLDAGRKRDIGDTLVLDHGVEDGRRTAAACNALALLAGRERPVTAAMAVRIAGIYGAEIAEMLALANHATIKAVKMASFAGVLAFLVKATGEDAREFAAQLYTGANLADDHPAFRARRKLMAHKAGPGISYKVVNIQVTATAFAETRGLRMHPHRLSAWLLGLDPENASALRRITGAEREVAQ